MTNERKWRSTSFKFNRSLFSINLVRDNQTIGSASNNIQLRSNWGDNRGTAFVTSMGTLFGILSKSRRSYGAKEYCSV